MNRPRMLCSGKISHLASCLGTIVAVWSFGFACTKVEPLGHAPSANGATASASPPVVSSADVPPVFLNSRVQAENWVEAVRLEQWPIVATLIDALPEAKSSLPEVRYVRARAAIAQSDHKRAIELLDGLEARIPLLGSDIGLYRAEAQLHAGQHAEAAKFFAQSSSVRSLTNAAEAWSRAGHDKPARATIDRAIHLAKNRTDDEVVDARQLRADLSEAAGDKKSALIDLRFIARYARDAQQSEAASVRLERLDPTHRLTSGEYMDRAHQLANRGEAHRASEEIERAIVAPGGPPSTVEQLLTRAKALYESRDSYARAAEVYEQASSIPGAHVPQALYLAAKAWSRADLNQRGLDLYARLIRGFPQSPWAEQAGYYAPRLHRLQAQWTQAGNGYRAYLKRYPRGKFANRVRHELALCLLMSGDNANARLLFEKLAGDEGDTFDAVSSRYLAAIAAHQDGKQDRAVATWRSIIAAHPMSWFALASAARLESVGQSPPPPIPPPPTMTSHPITVTLPHAVRLLRDIGLDRDAEDLLRPMEYAIDRAHGDRGGEALCSAYQQLDTGERLHRIGQRHAPIRLIQMAPSNATRWAWECLYPRPYRSMVSRLETNENLPEGLLYAIMRQESAFNPDATSPVGARGLLQLMPRTAAKTARLMSVPFDPKVITSPGTNMQLGARYLSILMKIFRNQIPLAVGCYNAGPHAVGRWVARTGDVPLDVWVALVPYLETRRYIWRVVGNFARYRYIALGEAGIPTLDLRIPEGIKVPDDAY